MSISIEIWSNSQCKSYEKHPEPVLAIHLIFEDLQNYDSKFIWHASCVVTWALNLTMLQTTIQSDLQGSMWTVWVIANPKYSHLSNLWLYKVIHNVLLISIFKGLKKSNAMNTFLIKRMIVCLLPSKCWNMVRLKIYVINSPWCIVLPLF